MTTLDQFTLTAAPLEQFFNETQLGHSCEKTERVVRPM
jgi:hypothetical protein